MDWIKSRSVLLPNKCAVIDTVSNNAWTYSQLNDRSAYLAEYFLSIGVQKGYRIALLATNHVCYFDFLFACIKIGAIFVPLNWRLSTSELGYMLEDCTPTIVGIQSSFIKQTDQWKLDFQLLEIDSNNYISRLNNRPRNTKTKLDLSENDPLAMIYTGGTTGKPKGAVLSHRSIVWNGINTIVSWNLTDQDTTLTCLPMFHTGGLNALSIPILMAGGTVVLSPSFRPEQAVKHLIDYKCTIVLFVPTMYHMLIKSADFEKANFPNMKVFLSGGAPCPLGIYEIFSLRGFAFKEGYGLTEAGPNNFYIDPKDAKRKPGSVGKPMLFNEVKIVNSNGNKTSDDEVGELLLRGNHLFDYYWNKKDATSRAIVKGWLHTGDLARMDDEGYVYIVGRKKDMIITGGENVYPLEIENWMESHDSVEEIAVIGVSDEKWGEMVIAFVAPHHNVSVTEEELKEYCKKKMASYKIPKRFYIVDQLPKTHVGKINKNQLKKQLRKVKED
nr:long-chain fatty acid--CoA ligase [Aquibacillus halophilus]